MTTENDRPGKIKRAFHFIAARLRSADFVPLFLCCCVAVMYYFLCPLAGKSYAGFSGYLTYTLQALAWRDGTPYLDGNYEWLELAFYQGKWYSSFPPVPSIPLYFLTFIYGYLTPDNLLVKIYVFVGCIAIYRMLLRGGYGKISAAGFALLCSYASCLLALTTEGAVWYQAQTLAFCLTSLSLALMLADKPTLSLFLYALAVGCRPFNVAYGLLLFCFYALSCQKKGQSVRQALLRLLPGLLLGFAVAFAYGWYNYIRFDDPFEFGHNYLPEFSWQGGVQFSLSSVPHNIQNFVLRMPWVETVDGWELQIFGFCFLIASPVFALMLIWIVVDVVKRRFTWIKGIILFCFMAQLFLLLLHRTFGGYQFGARYTCDLLPYAAAYLALKGHARRMHIGEAAILAASFAFAVYGFIKTPL